MHDLQHFEKCFAKVNLLMALEQVNLKSVVFLPCYLVGMCLQNETEIASYTHDLRHLLKKDLL